MDIKVSCDPEWTRLSLTDVRRLRKGPPRSVAENQLKQIDGGRSAGLPEQFQNELGPNTLF